MPSNSSVQLGCHGASRGRAVPDSLRAHCFHVRNSDLWRARERLRRLGVERREDGGHCRGIGEGGIEVLREVAQGTLLRVWCRQARPAVAAVG